MSRCLEEKPLIDEVFFILVRRVNSALFVVLLSNVDENSARLPKWHGQKSEQLVRDGDGVPDYKVVIVMVNEDGDTTVGVELGEFRTLLLIFLEIEEHRLVCEVQFLEDVSDFPVTNRSEPCRLVMKMKTNTIRLDQAGSRE